MSAERPAAPIPARPAPPRPRAGWSWHHPATRARIWQLLALLGIAALLGWLIHNTQSNMAARGIQSGWDFLGQTAGFDIGEQPIAYESSDSYWRAFAVGLLNTLRVALAGIVLCTLLGALVGIGRFSRNLPVRALCRGYVELFRNVPLLVQLLVWYLLLVEYLPDTTEAWSWGGAVFLSKSGLVLPFAQHGADGWHWSRPVLEGFSIEGGAALSPEFLAVLAGLTFYTAAFVAEVVRAGILAVPRGQIEAAQSIALSRWQTLRLVTGPQALRVMAPALTNQYLNLTKNSSLAVAVGYPDLVSIANTSLNQTGRALECIAIVMAVYLTLSLATALLMGGLDRRDRARQAP
ncbi:amino acid ABC transporter permease [Comamonas endophytica]|uniref:ABC transporter permease subunit n=1 Tax=Comamonas endophytica TaxID=2949090 RepID=A0ABY6G6M7_9BURK|nr:MULTISPECIES: ABC transporter permease subunit [unclassified Acidovorax]MCD2511280.1 ABC transporter permease subunit [Acidovorax sp. D4N7]UYG50675.1 ABC transporter permease subunit [Acidovorax sp. 5MLIR]